MVRREKKIYSVIEKSEEISNLRSAKLGKNETDTEKQAQMTFRRHGENFQIRQPDFREISNQLEFERRNRFVSPRLHQEEYVLLTPEFLHT